jgi:chloramphenicol-sensitive protein RarD
VNEGEKRRLQGVLAGTGAYVTWGILPVYWKGLVAVPAMQILAHRIFWSFGFLVLCLIVGKQWPEFKKILIDPHKFGRLLFCAVMISINWGTFIWAVNAGLLVQTSLGYYINPLLAVLLGIVILHERATPLQYVSFALAGAAVLYLTFGYGEMPWVALILAVSFALYGLAKKTLQVGSLAGLAIETAILLPFAAGYIIYCELGEAPSLLAISPLVTLLLVLCGVVTATPLLLFAAGANRISLSTMGFLQYLSPTLTLLLGVFVYGESFTHRQLLAFSLIWVALFLYSLPILRHAFMPDIVNLEEL